MFLLLIEKFLQPIDLLKQWLSSISHVVSVSLIGSASRNFVTRPGDIDLLVIINTPCPKTFLANRLTKIARNALIDTVWTRSEDIIRAQLNGVLLNIAPFRPKEFTAKFEAVVTSCNVIPEQKDWSISGYIPEVLCGDVCDAVVLFEREVFLSLFKERLKIYPEAMRKQLICFCSDEVRFKVNSAEQALKDGDLLLFEYTFNATLFPLIRGLFAVERVYFRGIKHLDSQLSSLLSNRYGEITCIFGPSSLPSPQERLRRLRQLGSDIAC